MDGAVGTDAPSRPATGAVASRRSSGAALTLAPVPAEVAERLVDRESGSFLQLPGWAGVKPGWTAEQLGWFRPDGTVAGVGTVLYRRVPGTRRSLAYLPEGPCLPWEAVAAEPDRWLEPLAEHARARGAFTLRAGFPVVLRRWQTGTVRRGLAAADVRTFRDLPPDVTDPAAAQLAAALQTRGWRPLGLGPGFTAGQPRYGVRVPIGGRTVAELQDSLSPQWRRNLARARDRGVTVRRAGSADLPAFHRLYTETATRDGFTARPETYFRRMWQSFDADAPTSRLRLHLAELGGLPLAAAVTITSGSRVTYVYGASTAVHREVRAANALHGTLLRTAAEQGMATYDLRGIGDTLEDGDPLAGLLRFKLGLRGECVEYLGEWERPLSPLWDRAYRLLLAARAPRRTGTSAPTGRSTS